MSFFRPEAMGLLRRYAMPVGFAVLGGFLIWQGLGWIRRGDYVGYVVLLMGAFSLLGIFGAVERALLGRFSARRGPGAVSVDEGRIAYFAPEGGGVIAIDALARVEIITTDEGPFAEDLFWVFTDIAGQVIIVPGSAENATAILDGLESLPGLDHKAVFAANVSVENGRFLIWDRDRKAVTDGPREARQRP